MDKFFGLFQLPSTQSQEKSHLQLKN